MRGWEAPNDYLVALSYQEGVTYSWATVNYHYLETQCRIFVAYRIYIISKKKIGGGEFNSMLLRAGRVINTNCKSKFVNTMACYGELRDIHGCLIIKQKQLYLPLSNKKHRGLRKERRRKLTRSRGRSTARTRLRLLRHDTCAFNFNNGRKLIGYRRCSGVSMTGRTVAPEAHT